MSSDSTPPLPPIESPPPESMGEPPAPLTPPRTPIPADLDTPWDKADVVIFFAFGLLMLFLISSIFSALAVAYLHVPVNQVVKFGATNAGFVVSRQVVWFGCLLVYLYAVIRRRTAEPFWRAIGWRKLRLGEAGGAVLVPAFLLGGAMLALGADLSSFLYKTTKELPIEALYSTRRGLEYVMAFGILVAPLVEETVFRGFVYPVLARRFGIFLGITLTGALFGLVHMPQLWGGWGQIATLLVVGIVLTAARAAGHSVLASYLMHLGYNGFLFAGIFMTPEALRTLHP